MSLRWLLPFLCRVYLLRAPLLSALGIAGFCFAAFVWPPGVTLLLGNAFDIGSFWGVFSVSWIVSLAGWVVMVTWRLVRLYGHERFFGIRADSSWQLRWRELLPLRLASGARRRPRGRTGPPRRRRLLRQLRRLLASGVARLEAREADGGR